MENMRNLKRGRNGARRRMFPFKTQFPPSFSFLSLLNFSSLNALCHFLSCKLRLLFSLPKIFTSKFRDIFLFPHAHSSALSLQDFLKIKASLLLTFLSCSTYWKSQLFLLSSPTSIFQIYFSSNSISFSFSIQLAIPLPTSSLTLHQIFLEPNFLIFLSSHKFPNPSFTFLFSTSSPSYPSYSLQFSDVQTPLLLPVPL